MSSTTVALSGPKRTRKLAELVLTEAGYEPLRPEHPQAHAAMDWSQKFPDEKKTTEWITVVADNVNAPVALVTAHGWVLRMHYPTPPAPKPSPEQALTATIAEMRAEIDALKQKVS